jgi:hypothetical protein
MLMSLQVVMRVPFRYSPLSAIVLLPLRISASRNTDIDILQVVSRVSSSAFSSTDVHAFMLLLTDLTFGGTDADILQENASLQCSSSTVFSCSCCCLRISLSAETFDVDVLQVVTGLFQCSFHCLSRRSAPQDLAFSRNADVDEAAHEKRTKTPTISSPVYEPG